MPSLILGDNGLVFHYPRRQRYSAYENLLVAVRRD